MSDKQNYYLIDRELYYEIVLSKGMGKLTKKAEKMLILIAENMILKFDKKYKNEDDKLDCMYNGMLHLFNNWKSFNENKYQIALPYFSEIFKRGVVDGLYKIINKKNYNDTGFKTISLDSSNDGKGLHSI